MSRRRRPCRSSISGPCSLPPSTVPKPPSASHASRWAWVVGLVVTLALLTWALHDIDPRELVGHLRRADPLLLLAAVALATLTFPLRTLRWQLILRDVGGQRLPLLPLWHATAIGFMANNLLPVRAGRSEEHTSELQSQSNLVCRLLLEKKKTKHIHNAKHYLQR